MWFDGDTYNANVFDNAFADLFTAALTASAGVIKGVGGNLACTGATSPVAVAAGAALVNGKYYANSASIDVAVASPAVNPRIDRIVLRIGYAAKTILVKLLAGAENVAPTPPALTQTDGTTWEISLCQVLITTGGVITVTDERKWCRPRGLHNKGDIKMVGKTVTFSGHFPVDADTGIADPDWHLCNGDTQGGWVTTDLRDMFVLSSGSTYARNATGGAATKNLAHVHAQAVHLHAQTVHLHAQTVHSHAAGTLSAPQVGHTGTTGVPSADSVNFVVTSGTEIPPYRYHTHDFTTNAGAAQTVTGSTANSGAVDTGNSAAANTGNSAAADTGSASSATQDIMPPYFTVAYVEYVGL